MEFSICSDKGIVMDNSNEKVFFTYEQQISKLKDKKLEIDDEELAIKLLKENSYYALISGYKEIFKSKDKDYKLNTKIEDIYKLYDFDSELRSLFLKNILKVENHIKSLISYSFCKQYGENQLHYLTKDNYNTKCNQNNMEKLITKLKEYVDEPKYYRYMSYQKDKYKNIPLWIMMKALTLGSVSQMYSLLKHNIQSEISKEFQGIKENDLGKMLDLLSRIRNVSAHNERLFDYRYKKHHINNTTIHSKLNIPKYKNHTGYRKGTNDLFSVIITFKYLLNKNDFIVFIDSLDSMINELCNDVTNINKSQIYKYMGLTDNWKDIKNLEIQSTF